MTVKANGPSHLLRRRDPAVPQRQSCLYRRPIRASTAQVLSSRPAGDAHRWKSSGRAPTSSGSVAALQTWWKASCWSPALTLVNTKNVWLTIPGGLKSTQRMTRFSPDSLVREQLSNLLQPPCQNRQFCSGSGQRLTGVLVLSGGRPDQRIERVPVRSAPAPTWTGNPPVTGGRGPSPVWFSARRASVPATSRQPGGQAAPVARGSAGH